MAISTDGYVEFLVIIPDIFFQEHCDRFHKKGLLI